MSQFKVFYPNAQTVLLNTCGLSITLNMESVSLIYLSQEFVNMLTADVVYDF